MKLNLIQAIMAKLWMKIFEEKLVGSIATTNYILDLDLDNLETAVGQL